MYGMTWGDIQRQEDGAEPAPLAFVAGIDFDPYDHDEVEIIKDVMDRHAGERADRLERENQRLRARLAELTGDEV